MTIPTRPPTPSQSSAPTDQVATPSRRLTWVATLVALVAVLVIALVLAAGFRGKANQLLGSAAASNAALLDAGATSQISEQVREAVQRVFSYDFARLDDDERAAAEVITGSLAQDYRQEFGLVRRLAPEQQAVVVAKVPALAVKMLDGDRATVVVFIERQAVQGPQTQPLLGLTVTAQRVAGSWKLADVEPF